MNDEQMSFVDLKSTEARNEALKQEIDQLHTEILRIKSSQLKLRSESSNAKKRLRYLKLVRNFRAPANSYQLWRLGVLLVGPLAVGVFCLLIVGTLFESLYFAIGGAVVGLTTALAVIAVLLAYPRESQLLSSIDQAETDIRVADARCDELNGTNSLAGIDARLRELLKEQFQQKERLLAAIAEINRKRDEANIIETLKRQSILLRDWKALRGMEWEQYLVTVFRALGGRVEQIGGAGDQGVDLIVEFETMKIAVQAKGYDGAVNNKAVQEAFTGMVHHRCTACAVITNSRFQISALALAKSTNCILIGGDEFPDFVMGKLELKVLVNEIGRQGMRM